MQIHKVKEDTIIGRILTFVVGLAGVALGAFLLLAAGHGF